MKFLADENIAVTVVKFLRLKGLDVRDVKEESMQGLSDKEIFKLAKKQDRIILTHDKDFLQIVKNEKDNFEGIILIRCSKQNPKNISETLDKIIDSDIMRKVKNSVFILTHIVL